MARVSVSAVAAFPAVVEVCSATGVRRVLLLYMLAKVSAVAGDLLCCGIKKIKHFRLLDYDSRTGNFSIIVISIIRPIIRKNIGLSVIRLRNPLSNYRLSEPAFKV